MQLQQNTDRIQTTHIGSLPRPHVLLDAMKAKYSGQNYDERAYRAALRDAVTTVVREQVDCGIDIVTDGEFSKPGFFTYVRERLEGFESRPGMKVQLFQQEVAAFPEYYEQYFKRAMMGGAVVSLAPVVCVGPVKYRGEKLVAADIENVKAAAAAAGVANEHVFLAGDRAVRRRQERVLQIGRGVFPRARCGNGQGIPGDRRCRHPRADRRSVSAGYVL